MTRHRTAASASPASSAAVSSSISCAVQRVQRLGPVQPDQAHGLVVFDDQGLVGQGGLSFDRRRQRRPFLAAGSGAKIVVDQGRRSRLGQAGRSPGRARCPCRRSPRARPRWKSWRCTSAGGDAVFDRHVVGEACQARDRRRSAGRRPSALAATWSAGPRAAPLAQSTPSASSAATIASTLSPANRRSMSARWAAIGARPGIGLRTRPGCARPSSGVAGERGLQRRQPRAGDEMRWRCPAPGSRPPRSRAPVSASQSPVAAGQARQEPAAADVREKADAGLRHGEAWCARWRCGSAPAAEMPDAAAHGRRRP